MSQVISFSSISFLSSIITNTIERQIAFVRVAVSEILFDLTSSY